MSSTTLNGDATRDVAASQRDNQYFAVPIAILIGLSELNCNVYIQHPTTSQKLLYRKAGSELPVADFNTLRKRNVRFLYLRTEDERKFKQSVSVAAAKPPDDPATHVTLTAEQHRDAFETALRASSVAPMIAASETIASKILQAINRDDFAVSRVVDLLGHDRCTFQHSCNVSIYAATLAKRIGVPDDELKLLTTGGLLHDIGKRQIPSHILRKPGKLDDREREVIRQHPTIGFRELAAMKQLHWGQLMMTYQHHEWTNGQGYPVGVMGDEIHLWAKICAIVDVFDALTANRPYRESGLAGAALQLMSKEAGHFDRELYSLWVEVLTA